jgi:putative ubiquitin-RnfH superfamily antitoxin RatB of RatAB toxin-antitoxin module
VTGALLQIEVAYARPEEQVVLKVDVPEGARVGEAIARSGLLARFPEIDLARNKVGIHARIVELEDPLANGDRVEIYRPLLADPKEVRRARARKKV